MARELGVADHVLFLGSKTPQQITDVLCEVSFTVVPSVLEAFGMVIIESFSAGVPVIGSRTTGIAEIVRDGRDGLLFETGNAVALAACVVEMLDDAALRLRCARSAREHFLESFELEKVTAAVAEHLASL
jgi:glycosyltransferase involved in cell wall biosynthesis